MKRTILFLDEPLKGSSMQLAEYDIVVRGGAVIKDRHGDANRVLATVGTAKSLGRIIEEAKPAEPRYYGRLGK